MIKEYKFSEEHRKKLSLAKKGKPGNRKGSPHSEDTKRRLSEANKGKILSRETKEKISKSVLERCKDPKFIEKLSKIRKGKSLSLETRKKISEAQKGISYENRYGKKKANEKKKLISQQQKEIWKNSDHILKMSTKLKGKPAWNKGKTGIYTEETKRNISINVKKFWMNNPDKHPNRIMEKRGFISSIEKKVKSILEEFHISFEPQWPILNYFVDFAVIDQKIIFECDGNYWHNLPGVPEYDEKRQKEIESLGWKFIRFSETEINKNLSKIKEIIKNVI